MTEMSLIFETVKGGILELRDRFFGLLLAALSVYGVYKAFGALDWISKYGLSRLILFEVVTVGMFFLFYCSTHFTVKGELPAQDQRQAVLSVLVIFAIIGFFTALVTGYGWTGW